MSSRAGAIPGPRANVSASSHFLEIGWLRRNAGENAGSDGSPGALLQTPPFWALSQGQDGRMQKSTGAREFLPAGAHGRCKGGAWPSSRSMLLAQSAKCRGFRGRALIVLHIFELSGAPARGSYPGTGGAAPGPPAFSAWGQWHGRVEACKSIGSPQHRPMPPSQRSLRGILALSCYGPQAEDLPNTPARACPVRHPLRRIAAWTAGTG